MDAGDRSLCRRILQIHPNRLCNLRCLHCYSSSGPEAKGHDLPLDLILRLLEDAANEGYRVAGFSGGEPTLYRSLPEALARARALGYVTTVTTNGTTLTKRLVRGLRDVVSLLAISVDGIPESHNRIRASADAFERMERRLDLVRESGVPFGFIFTLTQHNLNELLWVADFALRQGASLLQVHPLELAGRAIETMDGEYPDEIELANAFLLLEQLQSLASEELMVQFDASDREALGECCDHLVPTVDRADASRPLVELVNPLVVEASGDVVPVRHGISRQYALGNLKDASLTSLKQAWIRSGFERFQALRRATLTEVTADGGALPFFNWYDVLAQRSVSAPQVPGTGQGLVT